MSICFSQVSFLGLKMLLMVRVDFPSTADGQESQSCLLANIIKASPEVLFNKSSSSESESGWRRISRTLLAWSFCSSLSPFIANILYCCFLSCKDLTWPGVDKLLKQPDARLTLSMEC